MADLTQLCRPATSTASVRTVGHIAVPGELQPTRANEAEETTGMAKPEKAWLWRNREETTGMAKPGRKKSRLFEPAPLVFVKVNL